MVHLHNGMLPSKKNKGAPTLYDSMDGPGEHYAKWNKPGSERQIPYDLTYKWNLINKTGKKAKYNQRHWNKEQTDSNQRRGEGDYGERKGRIIKEHVQRTHGQIQRRVGLRVGGREWWGDMETTVLAQQQQQQKHELQDSDSRTLNQVWSLSDHRALYNYTSGMPRKPAWCQEKYLK